jgi:hypothetical protein
MRVIRIGCIECADIIYKNKTSSARACDLELPPIEAGEASMDEGAEGVPEEDISIEEQANDEDIQDGTPVQANTVVANKKNLQQPSGTYSNLREATYSNLQQDLRKDLRQTFRCAS